jgi:dCMP deaminase
MELSEWALCVAQAVSTRSDCVRRKVGAVIVHQDRIVAVGYNRSSVRGKSCSTGHCPRASSSVPAGSDYDRGPGYCIDVHAEIDAILGCPRQFLVGSFIYVTENPCNGCVKVINAAGIAVIGWPGGTQTGWCSICGHAGEMAPVWNLGQGWHSVCRDARACGEREAANATT